MSKKIVLVVFWGSSFEHRVSLDSAQTIIDWLDCDKYEVVPLGISKMWKCFLWDDAMRILLEESNGYTWKHDLFVLKKDENTCKNFIQCLESLPSPPDVIFPIIHWFNGEDGRLQWMLDLVGIPYVGSWVSGSAICMDKILTKAILEKFGIPQLPYFAFSRYDWNEKNSQIVQNIELLWYPIFIKPANLWSSIGISKVYSPEELIVSIQEALNYDTRILAEKWLDHPREIELAVLGDEEFEISIAGEIVVNDKYDFYTYEAKYMDENSISCQIPARMPDDVFRNMQEIARRACIAVNVKWLSRVDFFIDKKTGNIYLNELNTIPDFTVDSMFPSLWMSQGMTYSQLLDRVIDLAV